MEAGLTRVPYLGRYDHTDHCDDVAAFYKRGVKTQIFVAHHSHDWAGGGLAWTVTLRSTTKEHVREP